MATDQLPQISILSHSPLARAHLSYLLTEVKEPLRHPFDRGEGAALSYQILGETSGAHRIVQLPLFEEAPAVMEVIQKEAGGNIESSERIRAFLKAHERSELFVNERHILKHLLQAAHVFYIVDVSHPFREHFAAATALLAETTREVSVLMGAFYRPEPTYETEWRSHLSAFFPQVRLFSFAKPYLPERIRILAEASQAAPSLRVVLAEAGELLKIEHERRLLLCAQLIATMLREALVLKVEINARDMPDQDFKRGVLDGNKISEKNRGYLIARFQTELREHEAKTWQEIARIFPQENDEGLGSTEEIVGKEDDLFSEQTWKIFGLPRSMLIALATAAGTLSGGTVDLFVGGASFMLGAGVGAVAGAVAGAAAALTMKDSDANLAGFEISQSKFIVGPHKGDNFPWILLDRSLLYLRRVVLGQEKALVPQPAEGGDGKKGVFAIFGVKELTPLAAIFMRIRWGVFAAGAEEKLAEHVREVLKKLL